MQDANQSALIIGVTGSIGRVVAAALLNRGWHVRAVHRDPLQASVDLPKSIRWVKGDAMHLADVVKAARGTTLIVHAANPPKYRNWRGLALPMLDNTIAAARICDARILLPAPIYNFGPDASRVLNEQAPQNPRTRKGQVRVEMELNLRKASVSGVRSIVVRAGDFFGPGARNSWLTQGIARSLGREDPVLYPGPPSVGHSWAYLPDLAETMVRLVESERPLSAYEVFHFRGHWFERGGEIAELVCQVRGLGTERIKRFPWRAIKWGSPFVDAFHEMLEMRYLWDVPLQLDNEKLRSFLGDEPHTPTTIALAAALGVNHQLCADAAAVDQLAGPGAATLNSSQTQIESPYPDNCGSFLGRA
jgi:nucleoside-diphosphate-sugar epimerase